MKLSTIVSGSLSLILVLSVTVLTVQELRAMEQDRAQLNAQIEAETENVKSKNR